MGVCNSRTVLSPLGWGVVCTIHTVLSPVHVGGNQRELARARNAKKQPKVPAGGDKAENKGSGLEKRKERDADIMRDKQKKAAEKKDS